MTEIKFLGKTDLADSTPLYKYLSLEQFLFFMTYKALTFSKISTWPDKYEGHKYKLLKEMQIDLQNTHVDTDKIFGICWTLQQESRTLFSDDNEFNLSNKELEINGSAPMWESYCKNGGVRIKTTIGKINQLLNNTFENIRIYRGEVYYEANDVFKKSANHPNIESYLFTKTIPYRYENEYRYILIDENSKFDKRRKIAVPIGHKPQNFCDIIDEILVSPSCSSWVARTIYNFIVNIIETYRYRDKIRIDINHKISQLYTNISQESGLSEQDLM